MLHLCLNIGDIFVKMANLILQTLKDIIVAAVQPASCTWISGSIALLMNSFIWYQRSNWSTHYWICIGLMNGANP